MTEKRTNSSNRRNVYFFSDCQFLVYLVAQKKNEKRRLVARIKLGFYSLKETKSRREDSCVRTGCLGMAQNDLYLSLYIKISKKWSLNEIYVSRDSKSFQLLGPHIIFGSNWMPKTKSFFIESSWNMIDSSSVLHAMVVCNYDMIWYDM